MSSGLETEADSTAPYDEDRLRKLAQHVLAAMHVSLEAELGIHQVSSERIAMLNEEWLGETGPTDVLSFPIDELRPGNSAEEPTEGVLGDVVLCPEGDRKQDARAGHS